MTETKLMTPTAQASKDEYYIAVDETCDCCSASEPSLVGVNGSMGQRKLKHLCDDCLSDMRDAPAGIYDPVVVAEWE